MKVAGDATVYNFTALFVSLNAHIICIFAIYLFNVYIMCKFYFFNINMKCIFVIYFIICNVNSMLMFFFRREVRN